MDSLGFWSFYYLLEDVAKSKTMVYDKYSTNSRGLDKNQYGVLENLPVLKQ